MVWWRCAALAIAAFPISTILGTFPYKRFPRLASSQTLCGKAVGRTIWYTIFTFDTLLSSRTTQRVCAVGNMQCAQPFFAIAVD